MGPKPTSLKSSDSNRKKANVAGFAKRQLRRLKAEATKMDPDVYEYSSGKNKRSAITLSLDKDEEYGADPMGPGPDGDSDLKFDDALRARILKTGEDGDAVINSDEDEEIDSDGAFEESDEERFAGFSFGNKHARQPSRKIKSRASASTTKVRFAGVDLDEDEPERQPEEDSQADTDGEEFDGNSDEFLDVLDVLDGLGEPDFGDEPDGAIEKEKDLGNEAREDSGDGEDDDEDEDVEEQEDDEDMKDAFAPSDTEHQSDEEALDNLDAFVSKLEYGKKRKAEDEAADAAVSDGIAPNRKRRMLKERTEAGVESEFGVHAASGSKLQLDDLLAPLASTSSLQALRKATKPLTKGDALPAPLPLRTQDRLDREAAYEQTKGEVDKWKATMKRIKEADHLSFPLQVPQKVHPSNSQLASKFKPSTELESAVDKLLRAAKMRDEADITKAEELKLNHLSVEEVAARRTELRKMRELMFRADAKAKRIAKIKSKTYRKIQRKSREKINGLIKEAAGVDGTEDEEEKRLKHEVERAKERATLRHKNTGKWAKAMKGRGELDVDQRRDIEEMLERGEALRAKIQGDDGSEGDDDDDGDGDIEGIKASAFEELRSLEQDDDTATPKEKGRGVFGMKFMQDAMAQDARRVGETADDFRNEMARMGGSDGEAADGEDVATEPGDTQMRRVGGRMTFRPGQAAVIPWPIAPSDSSSTLKSSEPALLSPAVASIQTVRSSPPVPLHDFVRVSPSPEPPATVVDVNPWLQPHKSVVPTQSRRKNDILIGKHSAGADKSKNQMKKRLMKGAEEREKARDDAVVEISVDDVLLLPSEPSSTREDQATSVKTTKAKGKEKAPSNGKQVDAAFAESDADSEIEAQEQEQEQQVKGKGKGKGVQAFQQRDLVALAFAGDNVVQDFEKLKKREINADAPREEDHTLPGWGSWGGAGIRPNPKAKRIIKKVTGIDPQTRADHGKPRLIISEKKDKKAAKYLTKDLPYPYTSRAQFERSMEIPIGTEWNTRLGFQRQTLPRVVKKMGTVIDPLEKMF